MLSSVTKHCNINCIFFQNSVEGPLEAASCEHSDLVRQLKETDAIAEILGRLYKVDELWGIYKHQISGFGFFILIFDVITLKSVLMLTKKMCSFHTGLT